MKRKTLVVYASRSTGNSMKLASAIHDALLPDCELHEVSSAPDPKDYDFIVLGTGIYRGWPDMPMQRYMRNCRNKDVGIFITLGAWPDSEHAFVCRGRLEGLMDACRVRGVYVSHGRLDPEMVQRMKARPEGSPHSWDDERARRFDAAESHPDEEDMRRAAVIISKAREKSFAHLDESPEMKPEPAADVRWDLRPEEIEAESFRIIELECTNTNFSPEEWKIARRLIHTTGDFSICNHLAFTHSPIGAGLKALAAGCPIYCDSNMIRSGISISRLQQICPSYSKDSINCYISDADVSEKAKQDGTTRALASLNKAGDILDSAIIMIGNAPLALAGVARMCTEGKINPPLIIGMPVGFVNVLESKVLLGKTNIPHIVVEGRRGGSTLAVATLHAIIECRQAESTAKKAIYSNSKPNPQKPMQIPLEMPANIIHV